ncbi:MAG: hypothetical protein AAF805_01370 [Planctomycetota bacterium]
MPLRTTSANTPANPPRATRRSLRRFPRPRRGRLARLAGVAATLAAAAHGAALAQPPVPPGLVAGDKYHLVFATDFVHGISTNTFVPALDFPAFGGLDAADWIVTQAAWRGGWVNSPNQGFNFDQQYTAVLSSSTTNAIDRLAITAALYNPAGERLAADEADFFDGSLENPVGFDQFGNPVTGVVWTGTNNVGLRTNNNVCGANWNNNSSGLGGTIGFVQNTGSPFSGAGTQACNQAARLYGVSPELTVPVRGDFTGDGAVDAADYTVWRDTDGQTGAALAADANRDGAVDPLDYDIWVLDFGAAASATAAPEPTAAAMLATAIACVTPHRRV